MPRPPGSGRLTKLTPQVHERIVEAIRMGASHRMAAGVAGIPEAVLKEWLQRGRGRDQGRPCLPIYAALAADVQRASEMGDLELIAKVRAAADTDWKAAAHILACHRPQEWSPRRILEMQGEVTVRVDERQGALVAEVIRNLLQHPDLGLSPAQVAAGRRIGAGALRAVIDVEEAV